jgi:hypothetical protein
MYRQTEQDLLSKMSTTFPTASICSYPGWAVRNIAATSVWKRGDEVGVEFLASPPNEALDPVQAKSADASTALKHFA